MTVLAAPDLSLMPLVTEGEVMIILGGVVSLIGGLVGFVAPELAPGLSGLPASVLTEEVRLTISLPLNTAATLSGW
jgi:hypothetical protein